MVIDVGLIGQVRLVPEGLLHCLDALLISSSCVEIQALFIKNLGIVRINSKGLLEIFVSLIMLAHIEVALGAVLQELNVSRVFIDGGVILVDSFLELSLGVVALTDSVVDAWVFSI